MAAKKGKKKSGKGKAKKGKNVCKYC